MYRTLLSIFILTVFINPLRSQDLFEEVSLNNSEFTENISAHGVSLADYDNDGDDDILILNDAFDVPVKLFRNDGNFTFVNVTTESQLDVNLESRLAVWFDADNDGWLDLYIGSTSINQFFYNNGDGTFSEMSEESGLRSVSFSTAFMVGDLNGDQWLDVYVANLFEENQLFLNHGESVFYNHIENSGAEVGRLNSMGGVLLDYQQDNDLDIYCVYDFHEPNRLFVNNGDANFENQAPGLNANYAGFGMGVDFADFNHDSRYDLYLSYFHSNALLMQQPDGSFEDVAPNTPLSNGGMAWGTLCADMNNDTFSDIFFVNSVKTGGGNNLLYNMGDGTFEDVSIGTNLSKTTDSYGCASSDLDGDGHLDLVIANVLEGGIQIMKNIQTEGNWLQTSLIGTSSNKFGVGAKIEVIVDGVKLLDEVTVGSGYSGQNSQNIHFGLGSATQCDSVLVHWPSGHIDIFKEVEANQRVLIIENESMQAFNVQPYAEKLATVNQINAPNLEIPETIFTSSGYSIARIWNETMLNAIRGDLARPTIHARNLFHVSMAMYDAWAAFDQTASPYFLGQTIDDFHCPFDGIEIPDETIAAQEEALSYAAFRILNHRFEDSPSSNSSLDEFSKLFRVLGYDEFFTSTDYSTGSPAALGNYIAEKVIAFGFQDGANEAEGYANQFYEPKNDPFYPLYSGDTTIADPNSWQPLSFEAFVDQGGNELGGGTPDFLSPEWGFVTPFSLELTDMITKTRDGQTYQIYHDPGQPPLMDTTNAALSEAYQWNFSMVAVWSAHLDQSDDYMIDISPKSQGNISEYPSSDMDGLKSFYNEIEGGDFGSGYALNPVSGEPYTEQWVKRADYARVLAEFWADGPDSETPPGHWFTLFNYVSDHPLLEKKLEGKGGKLHELEWDVKGYFLLGGALHDAAITAWSIKGYYDYIRPISAIRYMVQKGQSSSEDLPNYHPAGIPLIEGYIEQVKEGDALAEIDEANIGEIKLMAWKGPKYIEDPDTDEAGVDWILGIDWNPYQRATFVTPPFAGYVSGHSTFSRAAAEILTLMTGSEYFPGGMSDFKAEKNDFLVFEEGPSEDIILQWAKYSDASDQCSLSRIWGGIHPPVDDIPGRIMGKEIGQKAYTFGKAYFDGSNVLSNKSNEGLNDSWVVYPNPTDSKVIYIQSNASEVPHSISIYDLGGKVLKNKTINHLTQNQTIEINLGDMDPGIYIISSGAISKRIIVL